jgi:hypothetical protein
MEFEESKTNGNPNIRYNFHYKQMTDHLIIGRTVPTN